MRRAAAMLALLAASPLVGGNEDSCRPKFDAALSEAAKAAEGLHGVKIFYSWVGGYGPGDVYLRLVSDGESELKLRRSAGHHTHRREKPQFHRVEVPEERIRSILVMALDSEFGCMRPVRRDVCGLDFGRYTLRISVPGGRHDVWFDGTYSVGDYSEAMSRLIQEIWALADVFGTEFDWSAYGGFWSKCDPPTRPGG